MSVQRGAAQEIETWSLLSQADRLEAALQTVQFDRFGLGHERAARDVDGLQHRTTKGTYQD